MKAKIATESKRTSHYQLTSTSKLTVMHKTNYKYDASILPEKLELHKHEWINHGLKIKALEILTQWHKYFAAAAWFPL